jgi:hypothetical protein
MRPFTRPDCACNVPASHSAASGVVATAKLCHDDLTNGTWMSQKTKKDIHTLVHCGSSWINLKRRATPQRLYPWVTLTARPGWPNFVLHQSCILPCEVIGHGRHHTQDFGCRPLPRRRSIKSPMTTFKPDRLNLAHSIPAYGEPLPAI